MHLHLCPPRLLLTDHVIRHTRVDTAGNLKPSQLKINETVLENVEGFAYLGIEFT